MIFAPLAIRGAFRVEPERNGDDRGYFARTYCRSEFRARGVEFEPVQCSVSFNREAGVLRGLHLQAPPHEERKLVRCVRGSVFDVGVDLRPGSPTFGTVAAGTLSAENGVAFYLPAGCAHGFLTLEPDTELFYMMAEPHRPGSERGVRWDDARLAIPWPAPPRILSERDRNWPGLEAFAPGAGGSAP